MTSVLTSLAMVVGGLVAVAPTAGAQTRTARDVPVLRSDPAPKVVPERLVGDFANAPPHPSQLDPAGAPAKPSAYDPHRSVVIDAETTPTKKVTINRDGSRTSILSAGPSPFLDAAGWHSIDLSLVPGPGATLVAKAAPGAARLAARADGIVATVDTPAGPIGLRHPQASPATATVEAARATYKGALGGRDLVLDLRADGFEETVVLPDAKASGTYRDELVLPAGVTARDAASGVELLDAKGTVVATVSHGIAFDSAPVPAAAPVRVHLVPNAPGPAPVVPSTSTTAPGATTSTTVPSTTVAPSTTVGPSTTAVPSTTVAPSTTAVPTTVAAPSRPAENVATVEVGVDSRWFSDPARVFPVSIDPTVTVITNASNPPGYGTDTFGWQAFPTTGFGTYPELYVGNASGMSQSFIKFNYLGVTPGPDVFVTESHLALLGVAAADCSKAVNLHGIDATLGAATVWNDRPAPDGPLVSTTVLASGCGTAANSFDTTALARRWLTDGAPNNGLRLSAADEADPAGFKRFASGNAANFPLLYITYQRLPTLSAPLAPATGAVVSTATPTLGASGATDPEGDTVKYWFRATPAPDAESGGKMVDSGWLTASATPCGSGQFCYTAPVGALAEGVAYYWHVYTADAYGFRLNPATPFSFRIDLGLGDKGAQPRDAMGPASVNLASGNAVVRAGSPGFSTVNGGVGLAYAYNSQAPAGHGLTGTYYKEPAGNTHLFTGTQVMVRTDPTIDHFWGSEGPGPGVPGANFLVRWTGTVTAPATGSYTFAADHDDGMRMWVGGTKILDHWSDGAVWNPSEVASPAVSFTAGVSQPIVVEYYQSGGDAFATVSVLSPGAPAATQLPPTWLAPDAGVTSPVLSPGWTMSPSSLSYSAAVLGDRWVAFVDRSGAHHTYTWTGSGYAPPPGDDGIVGSDANGALTLHATDGVDYVFDVAGRLRSATSATDDGPSSASSLAYSWTGAKPRLATITDTATGRVITLHYGPGTPCAAGTPADALCQVDYWDATVTKLTYSAAQLARIEDPGTGTDAPKTDFAYAGGRMVSVRSPLAADAVAAPATGRTNDASVLTEVAYDGAATPRVASVTLPAPAALAVRPAHTYAYPSATATTVTVDASPTDFTATATFVRDGAGGLTVGGTDADGVALPTSVYDAGDRLLASTDAAGRRATAIYDDDAVRAQPSGRATHTYGPAPATCFGTDHRPNGTCVSATTTPPHTATAYDTDSAAAAAAFTGLAATYWPNRGLVAEPVNHSPLVPAAGALVPSPLPGGLTANDWSARYTGEVDLAQTGTYGFAAVLTGQARVFIDDRLVVDDAWSAHATTATVTGTFVNAVAGRHRIRVDYATDATAVAALGLRWTPPGGSDIAVPAGSLAPRYSAPTASVSDDTTAGVGARTSDVVYPSMANRLVTDATTDRAGARLVTSTVYETGAYLRPVSRTLPALEGSALATTYSYYATTDPVPSTCPGAAASQAKALKSTTGVAPAAGGALVRLFTYDTAGRVVGSSLAGNWTCTVYDARGRMTSVAVPAYGGEPAHTFAYNYAVGANPLVASVTDSIGIPVTATTTIAATVDLLGRVVSATDVWNKTTTSTYDQAGRRTDTAGPAGAVHVGHSPAGRVETQSLDGAVMATATNHATTGELTSVAYTTALNGGNGTSLSAITRHGTGMTTGLTWTGPAGTLATDAVVLSQSGRVIDETIDGRDADAANPNFLYDSLGRLTKARVAIAGVTHVLDYGFAATPACAQTEPGRNSNRSSVTDTVAGTPTTTGYCYDNADRLVSSTDTAVGTPAYDSHGNTTTLGTQTLVYDGAGRHMETKVAGTTLVRYQRDATGRITSRTEGTAAATRYGYSGPGDSPGFVMDAANTVIERTIGLVGGAMVTKRGGLLGVGDVWSYPNVHGDVMAVADQLGVKQGGTRTYDPFGQGAPPDNAAGNFDYGWLGSAQRPSEHAGTLATIEMGARQYVPSIGRFLQVDPVEGGSCNAYEYACGDPVNGLDLGGTKSQPALPPELEGRCNPLINSDYAELSSGLCTAYRYAQISGNTLKDFYYQGYNSLEHPVDVTQRSRFNQVVAPYFQGCAMGAATSAPFGAVAGPGGALAGAGEGCAIAVTQTALIERFPGQRWLISTAAQAFSYGLSGGTLINQARQGFPAFR